MAERDPWTSPLVNHLISLASSDNRAVLAALRTSLRPGHELSALRFVAPFASGRGKDGVTLPTSIRQRHEDDAILLAGLFALHPESGPLSLARALNKVWVETGSDSVEGRFRALLSASRADLAPHLRHAVSLIASKKQAINWHDLHLTISYWDHESDRSRRQWARDFWAGDPGISTAAETEIITSPVPSV